MSISSRTTRALTAVALTAIALLVSSSLVQTGHRARLSRDLEDAITRDARGVSVIVHGDHAAVERLAERHGARIKKMLRSGAVLDVERSGLESLAHDPEVDHLSGDLPVRSSLDVTAETTGATMVWAGLDALPGLTGRGVGIAVIDSGMAHHAALDGRVLLSVDFWNRTGRGADQFGHGTHVAGIIAGDSASPEGQRYRGMAPGANLINLRVLGPDGSGETSDVIDAIDWAVEHRSRYNIRVINLSLGRPVTEAYEDDPLCEAVERAVAAGIVVVASAGNAGKLDDGTPVAGGIVSPGNSPYALTVGALNTRQTAWRSDDVVTTYSSRGPTAIDGVLKPDLVAPGNRIVSLEAPGSMLVRDWPAAHVSGSGRDGYFLMSGSSMATAVVSGAVALLLEANSSLDPLDVKLALQMTAAPVADAGVLDAGTGSLNVVSAVRLANAALETTAGLESLPEAVFGGETVAHAGFAYVDFGYSWLEPLVGADGKRIVWGDGKRIVWGDSKRIVWGDSKRIVWGDSKRIVWGDSKRIVWGDSKRIVWGDSKRIVWGDSKRIVWGDGTLNVWGDEVR
jgi:serine protease AprX